MISESNFVRTSQCLTSEKNKPSFNFIYFLLHQHYFNRVDINKFYLDYNEIL